MFVIYLFFFSLFNNFVQYPRSREFVKLAVLFYFRLEQNAKSTTNQNLELNFVHRELAFSLGPVFTERSVTINTRKRAEIVWIPYKQNPVSSEVHGKAGYKEFVRTRMHSSRMRTARSLP